MAETKKVFFLYSKEGRRKSLNVFGQRLCNMIVISNCTEILFLYFGCHDTQHNDTQHNNTQRNGSNWELSTRNTQYDLIWWVSRFYCMLNVVTLNLIYFIVMQNVVTLSVVSLYLVSLCWVSLYWVPLCWVS